VGFRRVKSEGMKELGRGRWRDRWSSFPNLRIEEGGGREGRREEGGGRGGGETKEVKK